VTDRPGGGRSRGEPSGSGGTGPGRGGERRAPRPTRAEVVQGIERELGAAPADVGIDAPRLEAERLLCHVLGIERAELARARDVELSPGEAGRLARVVARRLEGEPLQHIEGTVAFRDLVLLADERAFLPRPETEQLVAWIHEWAEERGEGSGGAAVAPLRRRSSRRSERDEPAVDRALDVGTGSGAIALALVSEGLARHAVGLDVSEEALLQAAANRAAAGMGEAEVEFRIVDGPIWTAVGRDERFDLVVSNPPYVTDAELEGLAREVAEHEPRAALAGGPDGLVVIREILSRAFRYLRPGGALFLEIGAGQGDEVTELVEDSGEWADVTLERDLAGRNRFVRAIRPAGSRDGFA